MFPHEAARVLVIDDETAARYGMVRSLAGQGYEIFEASDGVSGLERAREIKPAVILSDINMPGMDGIALLSQVRQFEAAPLVILITAYGSEKIAIHALRSGAYDYIAKPYDVEELRSRVRNAAERQRLQADLRQSQAALLHAGKMAALAGLVGGVSHEINNPVGVLQSSVQTLQAAAGKLQQSGDHNDERATSLMGVLNDAAEQAAKACERIQEVVKNLQDFAQLDRAEVRTATVDECVRYAAAMVRVELGHDIGLDLHLAAATNLRVSPRDINQLIFSLLMNAVAAVRRSGRPGNVSVRTSADCESAVIEVSDTGCGIPPEHIPTLFEPGFAIRGDRVRLGLGLATSYQIAQAHNGTIQATSRLGEGSTFRVQLRGMK